MEEEMAARLEVIEKLREAVKELEKEKRDTIRRYNEQVGSSSEGLGRTSNRDALHPDDYI